MAPEAGWAVTFRLGSHAHKCRAEETGTQETGCGCKVQSAAPAPWQILPMAVMLLH